MIAANSARRALQILGDRWTLLILRDAFLGTRQFSAWQARLGVTPTVLTRRLKTLVDSGLFKRTRFNEVPPRVEYQLTEKGFDIYPIALMILRWEQTWFPTAAGPRIVLRHTRCGHTIEPQLRCGHCRAEVTAHAVRYRDGPGAGVEPAAANRLRRATITANDGRAAQGFIEHAVDILGDRWLAGPEGPPLLLTHKDCGGALDPQVTCSGCGGVLDPHDVDYEVSEGTTARPAAAVR
jgi:DNA-binding HxlR family transcriptional regulator